MAKIEVFKDLSGIKYGDTLYPFDECNIYENKIIEVRMSGKLIFIKEFQSISISKYENIHYYLNCKNGDDFSCGTNIYLIINKKANKNTTLKVGDVVFRSSYITPSNKYHIKTAISGEEQNDSMMMFLALVSDNIDLSNPKIESSIVKYFSWTIVDYCNENIVVVERDGVQHYELIDNLSTLEKIKNEAKQFKEL